MEARERLPERVAPERPVLARRRPSRPRRVERQESRSAWLVMSHAGMPGALPRMLSLAPGREAQRIQVRVRREVRSPPSEAEVLSRGMAGVPQQATTQGRGKEAAQCRRAGKLQARGTRVLLVRARQLAAALGPWVGEAERQG